MDIKILAWLRAVTLGVLIVLGCLHFKAILFSAIAIDFTKLSATQLLSFEWFVPLISCYALCSRRNEISKAASLPSWIGFGLTCLFLGALVASASSDKPPFQLLSLAGVVVSVSYSLWGKEAAKLLWFPMGFLAFAVPVHFYLDCLKTLSEPLPEMIIRFGTSVEQSGFTTLRDLLGLKGFNLKPDAPLSGIHSLFSMLVIATTFAHFTVKTRLQRWAVFCYAIPITFVANLIRSLLVCFIALKLDRQWAVAFYAHYSQYVTFVIGLLLMFHFANLLVFLSKKNEKPTAKAWMHSLEERETHVDLPKQSIVKSATIVCLVLILAMTAFFFTDIPQADDTSKPVPIEQKI
ncbi:MAG: exosortase/archaeosortase family protein [bacterium]